MSVSRLKDDVRNELDDQMQKGYDALSRGDTQTACTIWIDLWEMINNTMEAYDIAFMEDMDEAFDGSQSISNWSMDFEMELYNASLEEKSFLQHRIDFCKKYIFKSRIKDDLNNLVNKRVIAESYFMLGDVQEGERRFETYTKDHPTDCWGWINWSDQYGRFGQKENRDNEKAIAILKNGLAVAGPEDRSDMLNRLADLYSDAGMELKANDVTREAQIESEKERAQQIKGLYTVDDLDHVKKDTTVHDKKVGRNEPCPCGSGKKYKKCCGK